MNGEKPLNTPIVEVNQVETEPMVGPATKPSLIAQISSKVPPKIKEIFNKFYANKKIFWPVTIVFGLLFLTIFLGLIFGNRGKTTEVVKNTPTSQSFQATPSSVTETSTEIKLGHLKDQINALDVSQKRLQPPAIDFQVSF